MKPNDNNPVPLEAQYLFRRGREMIHRKKENDALVFLRQAVFIAPGFSKAYQEMGNCLTCLGRPAEASVCYLKASRLDPINCGMNGQGGDSSVPGSFLTCLIW